MASAAHRRPALDMEEIGPDRFLVHNPRISGLLKGEGELEGRRFTLTTWRRGGLLARLRQRGFVVASLEDQIAELPAPPAAPEPGAPLWRPLTHPAERLSAFDPHALGWRQLEQVPQAGSTGVLLRPGQPVRRRKGRGPASYYQVIVERGGAPGMRPLDETMALLLAYALAGTHGAALRAEPGDSGLLLPEVDLPPPYRSLLLRIAPQPNDRFLLDERTWPLAQALFARLGVQLER